MRVPITNNVSRQMNRQTKIKLTNLNRKSKDVAAFHAKRRHVPGHGRVQFLAFALHLSDTQKKKKNIQLSVHCCSSLRCHLLGERHRTPVAQRATGAVKVKFPDDCSVLHHCRHVDYLLLVPLFILDILFVPGHCSESTFRNFFSSKKRVWLFIFEKSPEKAHPAGTACT